MGDDRTSGSIDEPGDTDQGGDKPSQPERRTPPDRPGEPGNTSRADSRAAMEANQKPVEAAAESSESTAGPKTEREILQQGEQGGGSRIETSEKDHKESDGTPRASDVGQAQDSEREPPSTYVSPLERMPSYGDFADLSEEFGARSKAREIAQQGNEFPKNRTSASDTNRNAAFAAPQESSEATAKVESTSPSFEGRHPRRSELEWNGESLHKNIDRELQDHSEHKRLRRKELRDKLFEHGDDLLDETQKDVSVLASLF